ncbi:unnamed protein product [Mytilus coruscus]|uniref:Uncharacterized protein n=1 Tax=Mytilus coruscus TaxID=42192 RepID=A0A6J8CWC3_MYTCO|nr:unnamed protein product [Mytilus coruscus]
MHSLESVYFPDKDNNTINTIEVNSGLARTSLGTSIPPFHQAGIPIIISIVRNQVALLEPLPSLQQMSLAGAKCCFPYWKQIGLFVGSPINPTQPANCVVASVSAVQPENDYDFEICNREGKKNSNANCLSRRDYLVSQSSSEPEDVIPSVDFNLVSDEKETNDHLQVSFVITILIIHLLQVSWKSVLPMTMNDQLKL